MFVRRVWVLVTLVSLSIVAWASRARGGDFEFASNEWDGCSELVSLLRRALGNERVLLRAALPWGELTPADGVMIVHPAQPIIEREAVAFMVAGGRLAIVDDHGRGGELLARFKIMRRALPLTPQGMLRGNTELPLATVVVDESATGKQVHPTVASVRNVALNHATGLDHPGLSAVLEVRGGGSDAVAVAVAGQVGQGRLFAMSDPSAFINEMLRFPDNRQFAKSLGRYLVGGDDGTAGRLWILGGSFAQHPGFAESDSFRAQLEALAASLALRAAEMRRRGLPWWMHSLLAVLLLGGLAYRTRRAYLLRYRPNVPHYARSPALGSQGGLAGRVAVLGARSTSVSLALVELRLLLGEALAEVLGQPPDTPLPALVLAWRASTELQPSLSLRLDDTVRLFGHVERALVTGHALEVKAPPLNEVSAVVDEVLERLEQDS